MNIHIDGPEASGTSIDIDTPESRSIDMIIDFDPFIMSSEGHEVRKLAEIMLKEAMDSHTFPGSGITRIQNFRWIVQDFATDVQSEFGDSTVTQITLSAEELNCHATVTL